MRERITIKKARRITIRKERWLKSELFCPKCGEKAIWAKQDYEVWWADVFYYVCLKCAERFCGHTMRWDEDMANEIREHL